MNRIHDCEQNSEEWRALRAGLATSSQFKSILAKGEGKMRRSYLMKLAGEIVTGESMESYSNANMERGHEMEAEARDLYAFMTDTAPERVGFITNGVAGCSPDSLIGDAGMVEVKTAFPHLMVDYILKDNFPPEHKAQCQGALWVAEREWIDIAIYWPKFPLFVKRAARDEAYIEELAAAVSIFNHDLAAMVERVRAYERKAAA